MMDLSLSELPSGESGLRHFRSSFSDSGVWIRACIAYPVMGRIADMFLGLHSLPYCIIHRWGRMAWALVFRLRLHSDYGVTA